MSHLSSSQRVVLLAAVKANVVAAALHASGDVTGLQAWLNGAATPATPAWLPAAPTPNVEEAPAYTSYDSLTAGKRDSWVLFLRNPRDFARSKVRAWVVDVWGNATPGSNAEAVLKAGTESATRAQVALGGTPEATGAVTALDRSYSESVDFGDAEWLCQQA